MTTEKELIKNIRKTRLKVARMKEELPKLEEQINTWQDKLHKMLLRSERYRNQSSESVQDFVESLGATKNIAPRILNCFSLFGMKTVGDIVECFSEQGLLTRTGGLGEKSLSFIRDGLEKRRLYLRSHGRTNPVGQTSISPRWNEPISP